MKKATLLLSFVLLFALGCERAPEDRVMARAVPERADDFVFENNLIAGRFYGKALEGNPTSPGLDIWVKLPGKLVADEWYKAAQSDPEYYHHDHGGKDCYKVAVSLGGGASAPFIDGRLCYPATNYRESEIRRRSQDTIEFTLRYPEWEAAEGIKVKMRKTVTVVPDTYFLDVRDVYTFSGTDALVVGVGINRHEAQGTIQHEFPQADRYAIWEKASDQGVEPEDGKIGVAVVMPTTQMICYTTDRSHALLLKAVESGEEINYKIGSCWSKGDIKTAQEWFELVMKQ